jgi:hypothetical protein
VHGIFSSCVTLPGAPPSRFLFKPRQYASILARGLVYSTKSIALVRGAPKRGSAAVAAVGVAAAAAAPAAATADTVAAPSAAVATGAAAAAGAATAYVYH